MKRLIELKKAELRRKYSNVPEHGLPATVYSDKTANGLTKAIIDFLNLSGAQAERINSTGRVINEPFHFASGKSIKQARWIPGTGQKGTADIAATIQGHSVKIEVKMKDKQSEHQQRYQQAILKAGGQYWLVRSWAEFELCYDNFLKNFK